MLKLLVALAIGSLSQAQSMHGLYVKMPVPQSAEDAKQIVSVLKSNQHLAGVFLSTRWKDMEGAREKYDFSALDRGVAAAREAGKPYKLGVTPGMYSPDYIYADGAARFPTSVTNPNRSNYGEKGAIPLPWDPVFQKHFSRLIRKLGERYGSDPQCVAVTLTCANYMSSEMHLPRSRQDVETWNKLGLTAGRLLAVYQKYMDEWAAAFPGRLVCLHVSPSTSLDRSANEFAGDVALYGLQRHPRQLALQRDTLNGRKEPADKDDPILKYKGRLANGYQSLASFHTPARQGSVEMSALNYVRADSLYWELWQGDGKDEELCARVSAAVDEARKLGYQRYKQKLVATGLYRTAEQDDWPELQQKMKEKKDAARKGAQ
jgi:hypothetical protein